MGRGALIVFGHGSRDPVWADALQTLRRQLRRALPAAEVELAFLEHMHPTLLECVESLWLGGIREIAVLPAFVAEGSHVRQQLPELIEQALKSHDGLSIRLLPAMGDLPEVREGVVRFVRDKLDL